MAAAVLWQLSFLGVFALCTLSSSAFPVGRSAAATALQNRTTPEEPEGAEDMLRRQMTNPADILAILQIIGGDIIQKAIAQLSGTRLGFTPVAFSFGWVSYTFNAIMSVFDDGNLLPPPEAEIVVIDILSGRTIRNQSWVLWRLFRDLVFETPSKGPLRIFQLADGAGELPVERVDYLFLFFLPAQLITASIPWWRGGNWLVFGITAIGTVLAIATGSLPQWKKQKFDARPNNKGQGYILTQEPGEIAFLFIPAPGRSSGLRITDMAINRYRGSQLTRVVIPVLSVCWVCLLLTVGGLERDTWYLFAVGALGMVQNITAACFQRRGDAHGIPFKEIVVWGGRASCLKQAEHEFPGAGLCLVNKYPSDTDLNEDEKRYWREAENSLDRRRKSFALAKPCQPTELGAMWRQERRGAMWMQEPVFRHNFVTV